MPEKYYQNKVYPLQDEVLRGIQDLNVDFYLTGGTALSRCYLNHRYSDDLDLFVNDSPKFKDQCKSIISWFKQSRLKCEITTTSDTFVRGIIERDQIAMKIDFINDVPFHYGDFVTSQIYHRVDNWRNILSNKLCALSRMEIKDIVDILFIAKKYDFHWENIAEEAREKDLWVEPLKICKIISGFPAELLHKIKWITAININKFVADLGTLHDDIFYGRENSLLR
jgi:hypothetical protein